MSGHVIEGVRSVVPEDPDYDEARKLWNGDIDLRPAVIARCQSAADVAAAIGYARTNGLEIAIRGGAHSMPGMSSVDDGLVVDLSPMNQVSVDSEAKLARCGGGALLGDLDRATQEHGLAVPAGVVSHTGVGGLTVGGGMGWLTRMAGLTIDNLVSAEVVMADGRILRASDEENSDLFWAIRGGGSNFGVVTEFEFRLHEAGPMVQLGIAFFGLDQGTDMFRLARELIPATPRTVTVMPGALNAPPEPFVPAEYQLQPGYALVVVGFGGAEEHAGVMARIRDGMTPLFDFADTLPFVALQSMLDEANEWGRHCYDKGCYLEELTDGAIQVITEWVPQKNSPLTVVLFYRLDGAYSEMDEDATAFGGGRSPRYAVFLIAVCPVPELLPPERAWVRGCWEALKPHSIDAGSYVNAITDNEPDRVRAAYGSKYERLQAIKREYDPDNLFHRNANIAPA
jgi:FAD/FMN-containing dehydrogenase